MPKLAVILPPSLPVPPVLGGSIQTVVYDLLKKLKDFEIITFSKIAPGLPEQQVDQFGIKHYYIKDAWYDNLELLWRGEYLVRFNGYIFKIIKKLKLEKPDIIHLHNRPHFVPILRRLLGPKVKIILSVHNQKIGEDQYNLARITRILPALDCYTACSVRLAELDLLKKYPQYRSLTKIIYNPVELERFRPKSAYAVTDLKQKYGVAGKKVLLFVGRLVPEKAVSEIIEAFKQIIISERNCVLVIAGSSFFSGAKKTRYIEELEKSAEPAKAAIIFTGFIPQEKISELYAIADIFVGPVRWEDPSPKVMYEASACEVPIISTRLGGIPEIVKDGETALLLEPEFTTEDLQEAILALLHDPELALLLGRNGRQRMMENFSTQIIAQAYQDLYSQLLL